MVSSSSGKVCWSLIGVWSSGLGGCVVLEQQVDAIKVAVACCVVERNPACHAVSYRWVPSSQRKEQLETFPPSKESAKREEMIKGQSQR